MTDFFQATAKGNDTSRDLISGVSRFESTVGECLYMLQDPSCQFSNAG